MADGGPEIIIRGGSCEIHFDDSLFKKDENDPKKRKHRHDEVTIQRILITEKHSDTKDTGETLFDSKDIPDGFKGEIKIKYWYPEKA